MVKHAKTKAPKGQPKPGGSPLSSRLAALMQMRLSWFVKNAGVVKTPGWVRQCVQRMRALPATKVYSFVHLAGPDAYPSPNRTRRPESRRFMRERERRAGRRDAIRQLQRAYELPEAKGHELAAVEMALDGVPDGAIRVALKAMKPRANRSWKPTWPEKPPPDARSEVLARAARSAKPNASQPNPAQADELQVKASGEGAVDPGASTPPP